MSFIAGKITDSLVALAEVKRVLKRERDHRYAPTVIPNPLEDSNSSCSKKNLQEREHLIDETVPIFVDPCYYHRSGETFRDVSRDSENTEETPEVTGSFKERGARWALLQLNEEDKKKGVYAASAGNHALALSYHGQQLGIPINVVMPRHAPIMKIEACGKYGANVRVEGKHMVESRNIGLHLAAQNHGKYINGYDHVDVIAGAGTVALELMAQMRANVDAILVPVGGGGLIAGISLAIKSVFPRVQVIGVEAAACSGFKNSLEAGKPTLTASLGTLADGLAVPLVGCNAFETAKDNVDRMVIVSEEDIALAILRLVEFEKVVVEGAGAVGLAALLSGQLNDLKGKRVVALVTGGNIDSTNLGRCIERGMVADNRLMRIELVISDRPGSLAELTTLIAKQGAAIQDLNQEKTWLREDLFSVRVRTIVETRCKQHAKQLEDVLIKRYDDVTFGTPPRPQHITGFSKSILSANKKKSKNGEVTKTLPNGNGSPKQTNNKCDPKHTSL